MDNERINRVVKKVQSAKVKSNNSSGSEMSTRSDRTVLQPKLTVGASGDRYER